MNLMVHFVVVENALVSRIWMNFFCQSDIMMNTMLNDDHGKSVVGVVVDYPLLVFRQS